MRAAHRPPEHLSAPARKFWAAVVPLYVNSPGRLALLQVALEAQDRARACREEIGNDLTVVSARSGLSQPHPLLRVEAEAVRLFVGLLKQLGLDSREYDDEFELS